MLETSSAGSGRSAADRREGVAAPAAWMPDGEAIAALRRHPRFADAMMQAARNAVELYQGSRITNLIANDRGRFALSLLPLYLHFTRREDDSTSGFTASRLKEIAVSQGVCSAGRAAAMLALMRWAGLVAPAPASSDRRVRLLQPTQKLIDLHHARWLRQFKAMAHVLPEAGEALRRIDDPGFVPAFAIAQSELYFSGFRFKEAIPELAQFIDRNGGLLVLMSLIASARPGDSVPPREPVPASASELARRFHVSRTHVLTLLRAAADAGLLERAGEGGDIRMLPPLREAAERFFATAVLYNRAALRKTLAMLEDVA